MGRMDEQREAREEARRRIQQRPLYLDTETTGLGRGAEIVEICVLDDRDVPVYETLVRPEQPIPAEATEIHGIDDAMVASAPSWPEVWRSLQPRLARRIVGMYNASFDVSMIRRMNRRHGFAEAGARAFCVMRLFASWEGEPQGRLRLADVGRRCRIELPNAHRARADARLTRAVLHHMATRKPR